MTELTLLDELIQKAGFKSIDELIMAIEKDEAAVSIMIPKKGHWWVVDNTYTLKDRRWFKKKRLALWLERGHMLTDEERTRMVENALKGY